MSRSDGTAADADDHPVILFDGVCNLCNRFVQFVIERDPDGRYRFAPLQSGVGERLLADCGLDPDQRDTFVLVEDGSCYTKSEAALRVVTRLGGRYRLLVPAMYVPAFLRDPVYEFVAANRYDWFGKRDRCMAPTPDVRSRFLAGDPIPDSGGERDAVAGK